MSKSVKMTAIPGCDICKAPQAYADGKTVMGPWAYMCHLCFAQYGIGLGLGRGQKLIKG